MVTKPSFKHLVVTAWEQGDSLNSILANLKLQGFTKNSGVELSKGYLKGRIKGYLESKSITKRPVKTEK